MQALHHGKELYIFFLRFGKVGTIGIVISASIIGYTIYKTLKLIKKYDIENYSDLLEIIIGKRKTKYINIKIVLNCIINIFLIMSFFIMCAGISAYFTQELEINGIAVSIVVSILCYIILNKNTKGLVILNTILIPIIILFILILGSKMLNVKLNLEELENLRFWTISAILYASYNSITLISILIPMKKYIKNTKDIIKIAIFKMGLSLS